MISPGIQVTIGGKERLLRFTHNALILLERHDLGERKIFQAQQDQPLFVLRTMVWAGLGGQDNEEQVGQWIEEHPDLRTLNRAVWEAFVEAIEALANALGAKKNGDSVTPPTAEAITGPPPSASPAVPVS